MKNNMDDSIALVLCGGGGKGAFQIGVWRALEEYGLMKNVKAISGTSVGALNAVLFALGDIKLAEQIWKDITPQDMLSLDVEPNNICLFSREGMKKILKKVPLENLQYSNIDVYVTIRNKTLDRIEEKHINRLTRSEMEKILLATSAIPVAYPEVEIGGYSYEDAGNIELYNTPIYSVYNHGYRNICIVSLNYLFSIHSIENGKTKIDAEKLYSGCNYSVITPVDDIGGIFQGSLNFYQSKIHELIHKGYSNTIRIMEGRFRNSMTPMMQAPSFVIINRTLRSLIENNFKTTDELRDFVRLSGMECHHNVLSTENGGKIHWSVIVTIGKIEVQQKVTLNRAWNHYRFIETYEKSSNNGRTRDKKRCILSTFNIDRLIRALEDYIRYTE